MEIHQMHERGFKVSQIARKLGVSRTTIYKHLRRDPEEMALWLASSRCRKKKLDAYESLILSWLQEHPDLSAAQISDWLLEKNRSLRIGESTVRSFVKTLRDRYGIEKTQLPRQHHAVPDPPMGKQIQVDFGTCVQPKADGGSIRLYCIGFVLSHSRYKFVRWLDRPFTTPDVIQMHELAFEAFGGIAEELVYDQDKLILVSENGGDLILTEAFQTYREQRRFTLHVCRRGDPQSKGRIESVIKFVKYNFARHRIFQNLERWNEQNEQWLNRTGNGRVHNLTKKRPIDVFQQEKKHLRPVNEKIKSFLISSSSITRTVRKDNTILYQANRYSLPLGTYQAGKSVYLTLTPDDRLIIREQPDSPPLAEHVLCHEKGQLIQDRQHTRDRSQGISAYIQALVQQFSHPKEAEHYLEQLHERYPRYIRDQLQIVERTLAPLDQDRKDDLLAECLRRELFSANDFRDMALYLEQWKREAPPESAPVPDHRQSVSSLRTAESHAVPVADMDTYVTLLKGERK